MLAARRTHRTELRGGGMFRTRTGSPRRRKVWFAATGTWQSLPVSSRRQSPSTITSKHRQHLVVSTSGRVAVRRSGTGAGRKRPAPSRRTRLCLLCGHDDILAGSRRASRIDRLSAASCEPTRRRSPIGGTHYAMRPLRYSINVTLDGCCDHRAVSRTKRRTATRRRLSNRPMLSSSAGDLRDDGGSVAAAGADGSDARWMAPFGRTIDAAKKYVVSSTLERVDWNASSCAGIWGRPFRS